jgi:hypothetical protein
MQPALSGGDEKALCGPLAFGITSADAPAHVRLWLLRVWAILWRPGARDTDRRREEHTCTRRMNTRKSQVEKMTSRLDVRLKRSKAKVEVQTPSVVDDDSHGVAYLVD